MDSSKPLKLAFQNAVGNQGLTLTHRVNGSWQTEKLPRYIKSVFSFVTTDPAYPIEAGKLVVQLAPALEGNEYDVGFSQNQNTEPAAIIRAKPVPHQTWEISDDGRTATYIGPTIEAGYGPPIPPAIFVKGFTAKETQITSRTEQEQALLKLRKINGLKQNFESYKSQVRVTFHGREGLTEIINDIEEI